MVRLFVFLAVVAAAIVGFLLPGPAKPAKTVVTSQVPTIQVN